MPAPKKAPFAPVTPKTAPKTTMTAAPAGAPPAENEQEFDMLVFWVQHRDTIRKVALVLIVAIAGYGVWLFNEERVRSGSQDALSEAQQKNTKEAFQAVVSNWDGTPSSGTARLQLAAILRGANDIQGVETVLNDFFSKNTDHPLYAGGINSLGITYENIGRLDEALTQYQRILTQYPTSPYVAAAQLGTARIYRQQGKKDDARRACEAVMQNFAKTQYQFEAAALLKKLK